MEDFDKDEGREETKVQSKNAGRADDANDDDGYSDDDFEVQGEQTQENARQEPLQVIQEFTNESKSNYMDVSGMHDPYGNDPVFEKSRDSNAQVE